jgi:hypothetical protein
LQENGFKDSKTKICKNMQNIRRLNYFCKDGENRTNLFVLTQRFGGNHHHQALFLDCVKEKSNEYIGI